MSDLIAAQPGGSTPLDDTSGLKDRRIKTRKQLFAAEAENIRTVIVKYLASRPSNRRAPFSFSWFYQLHAEMFADVWTWAGRRRTAEKTVGVPVHQIEPSLLMLVDDLAYWRESNSIEPLEQAVRLHHRSVQIHPFENGNGRWSRMLTNILLRQLRLPLIEWPEQTIGIESIARGDYLAALRSADQHDYSPLLQLHRKYTPDHESC